MGGPRINDWQRNLAATMWKNGCSITRISERTGMSTTSVRNIMKKEKRDVPPPCLDGEEWKKVPGFNDHYYVSNLGRVYTNGSTGDAKVLPTIGGRYTLEKVVLNDGKPVHMPISQLVAECFCDGKSESKCKVLHLDGNLRNNHADNLIWDEVGDPIADEKWKHSSVRTRELAEREVAYVKDCWLKGRSKVSIATDLAVATSRVDEVLKDLKRDVKPPCVDGEIWARMGGEDGIYYVSNKGRVFSNGSKSGEARILTLQSNNQGYKMVYASDGDACKIRLVHRLVAKYFVPGRTEERNVVNHIDGDPTNNNAENLEWCTQKENVNHAINVLGRRIGGHHNQVHTHRPAVNRKLSSEQVEEIRNDHRSTRVLASVYGVDKATIARARSGEHYKDVD